MSTAEPSDRRRLLLERMALAGRELSDTAVLFHTTVAERLGLGPSDWKTLSLLEQHGPLTAGELSERSGLAPPSITGILDRLESRNWIRRERHPEDRRRVVVDLERAALVDIGQFFGGLMRRLNKLYARYSDEELERLVTFLTELARCQREATAELGAGGKGGEAG